MLFLETVGSCMVNRIFLMMIMVSALTSCAVTEKSLEASSETFENTTDTSEDITSSTSEREDFKHNQSARLSRYVKHNFTRLKADMAVGGGEYLSTLAALLAIDDARKPDFYEFARHNFDRLVSSSSTTPDQFLTSLQAELALARL